MTQLGRFRHPEALGVLIAGLITAAVISVNASASINLYDGGISSSAATFTLHGLLPYRDYWLLYGPLSGLVLAIPTAILGPSIDLLRGLGFAVICVQAIVAFRIARIWASTGPSVALAVSAVIMAPALLGLEVTSWPLAMTTALAALYLSTGTSRSGVLVGLLVGATFLFRLDVGAYALLGAAMVRDRRALLLGFLIIALPFMVVAFATTSISSLIEQLIWYPVVGPRQFRGLPGLDLLYPEPIGAIISVPLVLLPRLAIVLAGIKLFRSKRDPGGADRKLLGFLVFALLCQLQTIGRGDVEHLAQAATPALLLFAVWFRASRPSPARFTGLVGVTLACLTIGLLGHMIHDDESRHDREILAASSWIKEATDADERIFVGQTSHRFTIVNPLIVYYLADRAPGVRDTLFNPGVTNTDAVQTRMIDDLAGGQVPFLVLDRRSANHGEEWNDSRIPGSTLLDSYLGAHYQAVCDLGAIVIQVRDGLGRALPPCPTIAS